MEEEQVYPAYVIPTPANIVCVGSSQTGKTHWIANLLLNTTTKLETAPSFVLYCHNAASDQPIYDLLRKKAAVNEWHEGWPSYDYVFDLAREHKNSGGLLVVFDDIAMEMIPDDFVRYWSIVSHHQRATFCILLHNFYMEKKDIRTGMRSTTHNVLFATRRDIQQIENISRSNKPFFAAGPRFVANCYYDAMESFGAGAHLMLDTHPRQNKAFSVMSNIFEERGLPVACYQPKAHGYRR